MAKTTAEDYSTKIRDDREVIPNPIDIVANIAYRLSQTKDFILKKGDFENRTTIPEATGLLIYLGIMTTSSSIYNAGRWVASIPRKIGKGTLDNLLGIGGLRDEEEEDEQPKEKISTSQEDADLDLFLTIKATEELDDLN